MEKHPSRPPHDHRIKRHKNYLSFAAHRPPKKAQGSPPPAVVRRTVFPTFPKLLQPGQIQAVDSPNWVSLSVVDYQHRAELSREVESWERGQGKGLEDYRSSKDIQNAKEAQRRSKKMLRLVNATLKESMTHSGMKVPARQYLAHQPEKPRAAQPVVVTAWDHNLESLLAVDSSSDDGGDDDDDDSETQSETQSETRSEVSPKPSGQWAHGYSTFRGVESRPTSSGGNNFEQTQTRLESELDMGSLILPTNLNHQDYFSVYVASPPPEDGTQRRPTSSHPPRTLPGHGHYGVPSKRKASVVRPLSGDPTHSVFGSRRSAVAGQGLTPTWSGFNFAVNVEPCLTPRMRGRMPFTAIRDRQLGRYAMAIGVASRRFVGRPNLIAVPGEEGFLSSDDEDHGDPRLH